MIDVHTGPCPDGQRVHIMLEECGLPYAVHAIEQARTFPATRHRSRPLPDTRPAPCATVLVDPHGPSGLPLTLFDADAILVYLARKTRRFLPQAPDECRDTLRWLTVARRLEDRPALPIAALARLLERSLSARRWLVGSGYGIADIALWTWVGSMPSGATELRRYPAFGGWHARIGRRAAVHKAIRLLDERGVTALPRAQEPQAAQMLR